MGASNFRKEFGSAHLHIWSNGNGVMTQMIMQLLAINHGFFGTLVLSDLYALAKL